MGNFWSNFYPFLIAALSGSLIAVLGPINSSLQEKAGFWGMNLIVHIVGLTVAAVGFSFLSKNQTIFLFSNAHFQSNLAYLLAITGLVFSYLVINAGLSQNLPMYAFFGGLIGLLIIMGTVFSINKLGVLTAITTLIIFEIITGTTIDHFGLFGRPKIPFSMKRTFAVLIIFFGIYLTRN